MTRQDAVRALVRRKARTLGLRSPARLNACEQAAMHALADGHTAWRAIRHGVAVAAEMADGGPT